MQPSGNLYNLTSVMDVYTVGYLENGIGFLIAPRLGARLTHLVAYLDHGVKDEAPEENGVSHLIEHAIFNLNRLLKRLAVQWEPFKRQGARFEAWTGKEYTRIGFSFSPEYLRQALIFVRHLFEKPPLNKDVLSHERQIVLDEIARKRSRPEFLWSLVEEALALSAFREAEGPGLAHKLGLHRLAGEMYYPSRAAIAYKHVTAEDVAKSSNDLEPNNMALVGVGIDEDELTQLLEVRL